MVLAPGFPELGEADVPENAFDRLREQRPSGDVLAVEHALEAGVQVRLVRLGERVRRAHAGDRVGVGMGRTAAVHQVSSSLTLGFGLCLRFGIGRPARLFLFRHQ